MVERCRRFAAPCEKSFLLRPPPALHEKIMRGDLPLEQGPLRDS